ncbi:uncharacterized protein MGAL_10B023497 [Mytilus galloprovincialis]|uniref:CARD domain-containing protein n=1 Tax=Mytilus galloprovincialis TaxID=29158 RepID=A0A8B6F4Z0_MYTGA|nr:uncharacterized protein MGAL_10B023497 [Mytilus galloprovincialis]
MATNQPMNVLEWQLHCVLKRANLLQYYESFVREGECDVLKLSNAEDEKFHDVMEKVGMARKPLRIRQLRSTLLEWIKDPGEIAENQNENQPVATDEKTENDQCDDYLNPNDSSQIVSIEKGQTSKRKSGLFGRLVGFFRKKPGTSKTVKKGDKGLTEKNEDVTTLIKKIDDDTLSTSAPKSTTVSEFYPGVPHIRKDVHWKHTKEEGPISTNKLETKTIQQQENTRSRPTQRVIKDQKQHGLCPYYDELINKTVLDKMVLDNLISRCIFMIEDREEIIKPTTQRERNKVLLDILIERPYGTVDVFKGVLKESDPHNSDIQELISRMQCTVTSDENMSCHEINVDDRAIRIQKNYTLLVNNIVSTTDVIDYLIGEDIMQHEEREEVCASGLTTNESNRRLLDKLLYKDSNGYHQFLKALRHAEYSQIATEVSNTAVTELDQKLYRIGITKFRHRQDSKEEKFEDQFERRLEQWKEDDHTFVSIEAEKEVIKTISTESCTIIIGNSGTGKSFLTRHVALKMMKQGYIVIPCDNPGDIRQWFKPERKTLFVFDDVCGRYTLNQQIFTDWKQRHDHIKSLLKDKCCKIMATCRLEVYKEEQFNSLSFFKTCTVDLSSQALKLNSAEKFALAEVYFKNNADKVKELSEEYDFFPLLCSLYYKQKLQEHIDINNFFSNPFDIFANELKDMYREGDAGKMKYCSLVLCVMFNNTLREEYFSTKDKKSGLVIEDLLAECELNKGTSIARLRKSLETLEGTYVVKEDCTYKIIHDKLFDFLAKYFGEKMLQLFIEHAHTDFIRERCIWKTTHDISTTITFSIMIHDDNITLYIERLLKDWDTGYVCNVSNNRNMNSTMFLERFINNLNNFDHSKQEKLACTQDINNTDIALLGSCSMGNVDLVKWLISRKSDINYCGEVGWSPLLLASYKGHVDVVQVLVQHSAEINKCHNDGASPLYIASQEGHFDIVKELIQHSAEVNKCNKDGTSPLYIASQEGHVDVVKELIQHSADVNQCDNDEVSPLFRSCQEGHINVVKELLQHSAEVNLGDNNGLSPLYVASFEGHVDVVKELIQHSAEVNKCTNDGTSPLYIASHEGHVDVVKELIQHSAEVNKCNNNSTSPLYIASQEGRVDVVKELIKHSAEVNKCDNEGTSPLYIASKEGHVDVVKELIQHSAEVNKCNNNGASPLYIASQEGHFDVVKELIQHSAEVNKCKPNGVSPLYIASQKGHGDVVKELIQHSAEVNKYVNQYNNDYASPLWRACQKGHVDVVKELIQNSAEVNRCVNNGLSPLYIASQNGHNIVVKILLQQLADVNQCKINGSSPLYIASQNGHLSIVKSLCQHSAKVDQSSKNSTPLHIACYCNWIEAEHVLLQFDDGGNVTYEDGANQKGYVQHSAEGNQLINSNYVSPLYIASQEGHCDVVKELLLQSSEVNHGAITGVSPLYIACQGGYVEVVKELLQHSADVNFCNDKGASPLYVASQYGHDGVVKELLHHSANINKCDYQGKSPLTVSQEHGHLEIELLLLGKGASQQ